MFIAALLIAVAPIASAQVLTTEVWLGALDMRGGRFAVSDLRNISNHPGYDNQPAFAPDGRTLLFSSEFNGLAETGLGIRAVRYDIASGTATPLTKSRGFSPTPTPDGKQFMTLREGTVWLHDANGTPLRRLLPEVKTAGYFTRIDERRWVLFMNEPDRQIAFWNGESLTRLVKNAITAPYRIPGTNAVSFVTSDGDTRTLMRLDLQDDGRTSERVLATIPFRTGGAHVWTSRGTLLMASGNAIHEWNPNAPDAWPVVHRFDNPDLQGITRIALSPAEDRIALVSTPNDRTVLRESREAANAEFAESVAKHRGNSWVRTTTELAISGDTATERGTSMRRWGANVLHGDYTVTWRRTISGNGTPAWSIASETYSFANATTGSSHSGNG